MKINLTEQRPLAVPAACVPAGCRHHESIVGRFGGWALSVPDSSVRRLIVPVPSGSYGTSVSTARMIARNGVTVVNNQFTGDARGVPPRGRPV